MDIKIKNLYNFNKGVTSMKNICIFSLLLLACSSLFAQNMSLDQAVQSSARTIESRLPQSAKVAVLVFSSSSQSFSDYIIDELANAISASNKILVIDRQHTDAIRSELNIQMSGDVSDNEVRRIGHQLGAQYVVTGSLVDIGNVYRFRVAAINVESAVREGSSSINININDPQVVFLITGQRVTGNSTLNQIDFYGRWRGEATNWRQNTISANRFDYLSQSGYSYTMENLTWTAVNNTGTNASTYPSGYSITGILTAINGTITSGGSTLKIGDLHSRTIYINATKNQIWILNSDVNPNYKF